MVKRTPTDSSRKGSKINFVNKNFVVRTRNQGDHPQLWLKNAHIEILLYIGKGIFRFPKVSGQSEEIFINKVDFGPLVEASQSSKFVSIFQSYLNFDDKNLKKIHCATQKLVFVSKVKIRVGCHGHQGGPRPKIFGLVNPTNELVNPPKFHQNP